MLSQCKFVLFIIILHSITVGLQARDIQAGPTGLSPAADDAKALWAILRDFCKRFNIKISSWLIILSFTTIKVSPLQTVAYSQDFWLGLARAQWSELISRPFCAFPLDIGLWFESIDWGCTLAIIATPRDGMISDWGYNLTSEQTLMRLLCTGMAPWLLGNRRLNVSKA